MNGISVTTWHLLMTFLFQLIFWCLVPEFSWIFHKKLKYTYTFFFLMVSPGMMTKLVQAFQSDMKTTKLFLCSKFISSLRVFKTLNFSIISLSLNSRLVTSQESSMAFWKFLCLVFKHPGTKIPKYFSGSWTQHFLDRSKDELSSFAILRPSIPVISLPSPTRLLDFEVLLLRQLSSSSETLARVSGDSSAFPGPPFCNLKATAAFPGKPFEESHSTWYKAQSILWLYCKAPTDLFPIK